MAIGLEEKKSSLQTILIVLLVVSCIGALVFFALQNSFLKGGIQQSAPVEIKPQEIGVDFDFLKSGVIAGLKDFPKIDTAEQVFTTSSDVKIGRPNPFIPYQAAGAKAEEIKTVEAATSTQADNNSAE